MLRLPDVTLIAIDTANRALALRALERSCAQTLFGRVVLLTDALPAASAVPQSVEVATISRLDSRDAYSALVLKGLLPYVATSHVLLVQWDGYVLHPSAWDDAFLDCDYIGAKWFWQPAGRRVGNGGFSLRSRRLLEALQDPRIVASGNEDLAICDVFRALLEKERGIRFADEATADRFAFEAAYPIGETFGFHGLYNFCRVVPQREIAALAEHFSDAIAKSLQLGQLLRNCMALAQWDAAIALAKRRLEALPSDHETARLLQQAESGRRTMPAAGRNDPCPCGSGKRFKHCHGSIASTPSADETAARALDAHRQGDIDTAERGYRAALVQSPQHPLATHYLGVIEYQRGKPSDALPLLERAIELSPDEPEFHNNLGLALVALDRHENAIDAYGRSLARNADNAAAWNNLGLALTGCNRLDEAIAALRKAIALRPDFGEAHWNLALALLARGDYAEGWREYESRLALPQLGAATRKPQTPRWNGSAIEGKTLLLIAEQGLGDAIQFIRFARLVAEAGARVVVRAPPRLCRLFATVRGVAAVHRDDEPFPPHDVHAPLLSVALALGVEERCIVDASPRYIGSDDARARAIAAEIDSIAGDALKVGIAWHVRRRNPNDQRRGCPLIELEPLFALPRIAWFSLQIGDEEHEVETVATARKIVRLDARNAFDGTACIAAQMDLVVTVDTSIAHLAGALARPTWIMLPYASDWRWGVSGTRTPWYPHAELYRQPRRGDWKTVVAQIREALERRIQR